jgi:hypothetical protein
MYLLSSIAEGPPYMTYIIFFFVLLIGNLISFRAYKRWKRARDRKNKPNEKLDLELSLAEAYRNSDYEQCEHLIKALEKDYELDDELVSKIKEKLSKNHYSE